MTDATTDHPPALPHVPLGVGAIVSDTFSILFRKFIHVLILAALPVVFTYAVTAVFFGAQVAMGLGTPTFSSTTGPGVYVAFNTLLNMIAFAIGTALLIQLAYDAKLGRPIQYGRYVSTALRCLLPIVLLTMVVGILTGIGALFLIVPGIWIYAVFAVTVPVVVIESAGFGAMARSRELTKGYRWPIVGTILLVIIVNIILLLVAGLVTAALVAVALPLGVVGLFVLNAMGTGVFGIMYSMIYARLREIKDGVSVDQIASVFD